MLAIHWLRRKENWNLQYVSDMGLSSCVSKQRLEACRMYFKLENITEQRLVKKVFQWSSTHGMSWERRFRSFIDNIGLQHLLDRSDMSLKSKLKCVKEKLNVIDSDTWKSKLWNDVSQENGNKLRTYRLYKTDLIAENYVKLNMERSHRRILAKFRSGSLPLQVETGRYKKPKVPLENRICKFCSDNTVEDEMHFLISCDFYSDLRRPLFDKARSCNTDFQNMLLQDKFIFIMNYVNMQFILASTLLQMFNRRKRLQ